MTAAALAGFEEVARGDALPQPLDAGDRRRIAAARGVIEDALKADHAVYGVTTGFGHLAERAHPARRTPPSCS